MKSMCPFCTKCYSTSAGFDKHLRSAHPSKADEWFIEQSNFFELESQLTSPDDSQDSADDPEDGSNYCGGQADSDLESEPSFMQDSEDNEGRGCATTIYEGAGEGLFVSQEYAQCSESLLEDPWHPFNSAYEFRIARYFILSKASQSNIDSFFLHAPVSNGQCSYSTGRGFMRRLDEMNDYLGKSSWRHSEVEIGGQMVPYYYRDPLTIVRFLLGQRAFRNCLVYAPVMEYNESGERMYGEMHTADWWWETQVRTPKCPESTR